MPMWLDSCRTGLIRPKSGRISHIRSYELAADTTDTAKTCRKRPKSALNMVGKAETCFLLSFFCESRHSNVFFKNILIVKIYRKINQNIFNNFLIAESRCTGTHLFQKLPSLAPAPESRNASMLHRFLFT